MTAPASDESALVRRSPLSHPPPPRRRRTQCDGKYSPLRGRHAAAALSFTRSVYCPIIGGADLQCVRRPRRRRSSSFLSLFPLSRAEWNARCSFFRSSSVRGLLITPAVALHGGCGGDARCRTRNRARLAQLGREGGRDVNLEGEGRSRSLGSERASEAATYSVSEVLGPRVMGLLRVLLHHSSLPSFRPSCQDTLTPSIDGRMKSCLRSAHSLTRGIRTIPEVEPRHGGGQSLQCLRKSRVRRGGNH